MNIETYLEQKGINPELFKYQDYRIRASKYDPVVFAYLYLRRHITSPRTREIDLSEFHLDIAQYGLSWLDGLGAPKQNRLCFLAPRGSGKSTWMFLILPTWAGAHGHKTFIAAFSDSASQAVLHLETFQRELGFNAELQRDFPDFCDPLKHPHRGVALAANSEEWISKNNFTFMAKGVDARSLGMKRGDKRPEVLILDDIEPGESGYSIQSVAKRLKTLRDDIFPLEEAAHVAIVGTTTRPGGIIDQIRLARNTELEIPVNDEQFPADLRWVIRENIKLRHFKALIREDGEYRSLWPAKWSVDELLMEQGDPSFAKNKQCEPLAGEDGSWLPSEFIHVEAKDLPEFYRVILSVDPATTSGKYSDETGYAVIAKPKRDSGDKTLYVLYADSFKHSPDEQRKHVKKITSDYDVDTIVVETNHGGDLWKQLFSGIPGTRFRAVTQSSKESKLDRAHEARDWYQRKAIKHLAGLKKAETQMCNFPADLHDDIVDAVCTGILRFKRAEKRGIRRIVNFNYKENDE